MDNYFSNNNIKRIIVDNVEWTGFNKVELIKEKNGIIIEIFNECLTNKMADKLKSIYLFDKNFNINIIYDRCYDDGTRKEEVISYYCCVPYGTLLSVGINEITDLNLKGKIIF